MENYVEYSKLGSPLFDGLNYAFWSIHMNLFLQLLGLYVWKAVVNGYSPPERDSLVGITKIRHF